MLGGRLQKLALRLPLQRVGKLNSKALPESCTGYLSQSRLEPGTWTLLGTRAWEKYPLWRGVASTGYMWQDKAGPLYTLTPGTLPSTLPSLTWAFVPQPPGAPSSNWPASLAACQLLALTACQGCSSQTSSLLSCFSFARGHPPQDPALASCLTRRTAAEPPGSL